MIDAIKQGDAGLVADFPSRGFSPNSRFGFGHTYGMTPLHLAVEVAYWGMSDHAFLKVVPMLFEATEERAWAWGRLQVKQGHEENALAIISKLLAQGANPLALNGEGLTPIESALHAHGLFSVPFGQNNLFSRLVGVFLPDSSKPCSAEGDLFRALSKIRHEQFRNGWANFIDSAYELELDHLYSFFDTAEVAQTFSESELKWCKLAMSMAYIQAYEESGAEPTHSSIGRSLFQNRKALRAGWKRANAEMCELHGVCGDPLEIAADFCIEYCHRQKRSLTDVFEATSPDTPASINPALLEALSSAATDAWLSVMASITQDPIVIDRILKAEDKPSLRDALRCNLHLIPKHIDILARDGADTRLASNPVVATSKLNVWAKDEDAAIRIAVAKNPTTPEATLIKLTKDNDELVQQTAQQEIIRREGRPSESLSSPAVAPDYDSESSIRLALIRTDLNAFSLEIEAVNSPESMNQLLQLVCAMPLAAELRLDFANRIMAKKPTTKGEFIAPLLDGFITDLGIKNAERDAIASRDLILRLISAENFLGIVPAEAQCKLYDFHRKGRQEASEVLFALVENGLTIEHLPHYKADKDGASLMEKAIHHGDIDIVSRVVHSSRRVVDDGAANSISIAIGKKNEAIVDLLLSDRGVRYASEAAIKKAINEICYPDYGNPKGVESLSKLIAALRELDGEEAVKTLLFEHLCGAVENGHADLVQELIRNGAPVDHRKGNVTWGDLLGSFFEMNPKDKVFMALVDAGLDLNHPSADRYRESIQKILKRCKK